LSQLDRLLKRAAQPDVLLRVTALSVCLLELAAAVAGLLGFRTDAYDGVVAAVYLRLGGAANDRSLLIVCFALVLVLAWQYWQLARDGSADQPPPRLLKRILLIDLLAVAVTPGLPVLVTALAAVLLRARTAFLFALAQIVLNPLIYTLLPTAALADSALPAWLDAASLLMAMIALHGIAFGLGRMAAAETEKRRWLQAMPAEQLRYGERLALARELHDVVGHHLTGLNLQLQLGSALLERADAAGATVAVAALRKARRVC